MKPLMHNRSKSNSVLKKRSTLSFQSPDLTDMESNSTNSFDNKLRPSVFTKYLDVLDSMEQRIVNYIYIKCNRYKEMRNSITVFFQKEIAELSKLANEWHRRIAGIKDLIPADNSSKLPNILNLIRNTQNSNNKETLLAQRLEYEIRVLKHYAEKMIDYENRRDEAISKICSQLLESPSKPNTESPVTEVIEVKPEKPRQIMVKFDLHRPFDVYLLDVLDFTRQKWHFEDIRIPPDSASIYVSSQYFFCGGRSENSKQKIVLYKSTFQFDFGTSKFIPRALMHIEKRNHSLATIPPSKVFYSVGGYNEKRGYLTICEKYSLETNSWALMPPLREPRQDPTPCIVDQRFIYLFGGAVYSAGEWMYPLTIECFDTYNEANGWQKIPYRYCPEWSPKIYMGAAQINKHQIILFGGYDGEQSDSCFEYNLTQSQIIITETRLPKPASFIQRNGGTLVSGEWVHTLAANSFDLFSYSSQTGQWQINFKWKAA